MHKAAGRPVEGPYQVESPDRKWPRDGDRLECLGRQVSLPSVVLASFVGAYDSLSIGHRSWPVENLSERVSDHTPRHGMVPADPTVDITQQLLPLFDGDAAL